MTGGASERNVTRILRRLYPDLPKDKVPDRYPPRILLCSLMIVHHPEVSHWPAGSDPSQRCAHASCRPRLGRLPSLFSFPTRAKRNVGVKRGRSCLFIQSPKALRVLHAHARAAQVVFNGAGDREAKLTAASRELLLRFERLLARILDPPALPANPPGASSSAPGSPSSPAGANANAAVAKSPLLSASPMAQGIESYLKARGLREGLAHGGDADEYTTMGQRLVEFDEAWLQYLDQFAAWKLEDAASLETELVRACTHRPPPMQNPNVGNASHASRWCCRVALTMRACACACGAAAAGARGGADGAQPAAQAGARVVVAGGHAAAQRPQPRQRRRAGAVRRRAPASPLPSPPVDLHTSTVCSCAVARQGVLCSRRVF